MFAVESKIEAPLSFLSGKAAILIVSCNASTYFVCQSTAEGRWGFEFLGSRLKRADHLV